MVAEELGLKRPVPGYNGQAYNRYNTGKDKRDQRAKILQGLARILQAG